MVEALPFQGRGHGFDPGGGTNIPQASQHSQKLKKKRNDEGLYGDGLGHPLRVSGVEEGGKETGGTFLPRTVAS